MGAKRLLGEKNINDNNFASRMRKRDNLRNKSKEHVQRHEER